MAIGAITITTQRSAVVDFTLPYVNEEIAIVYHKPFPLPKWRAIFWPFQPEVWAGLAASLAAFGLASHLVQREDEEEPASLASCVYRALKALLMQRIF